MSERTEHPFCLLIGGPLDMVTAHIDPDTFAAGDSIECGGGEYVREPGRPSFRWRTVADAKR